MYKDAPKCIFSSMSDSWFTNPEVLPDWIKHVTVTCLTPISALPKVLRNCSLHHHTPVVSYRSRLKILWAAYNGICCWSSPTNSQPASAHNSTEWYLPAFLKLLLKVCQHRERTTCSSSFRTIKTFSWHVFWWQVSPIRSQKLAWKKTEWQPYQRN